MERQLLGAQVVQSSEHRAPFNTRPWPLSRAFFAIFGVRKRAGVPSQLAHLALLRRSSDVGLQGLKCSLVLRNWRASTGKAVLQAASDKMPSQIETLE